MKNQIVVDLKVVKALVGFVLEGRGTYAENFLKSLTEDERSNLDKLEGSFKLVEENKASGLLVFAPIPHLDPKAKEIFGDEIEKIITLYSGISILELTGLLKLAEKYGEFLNSNIILDSVKQKFMLLPIEAKLLEDFFHSRIIFKEE